MSANATPRTGARSAQPPKLGIRPVPKTARSDAAQAANALRVDDDRQGSRSGAGSQASG